MTGLELSDRTDVERQRYLKIINGIVKPDTGTIEIGQTIRIGYFSQENEYMDDSMKVIDYVKRESIFRQMEESQHHRC